MNQAEDFRTELQNRTPLAIRAVLHVANTTTDPRVQHDAREYLAGPKKA